jgi:hypothetical protein
MQNGNQAPAAYLLSLARRNAAAYAANPHTRAIMVTGSAAEGQSDFYSDLDIIVYYDELPSEDELDQARRQNKGSERIWFMDERTQGSCGEAYLVDGVECQVGHTTIGAWEREIAQVLEQYDVTSPIQKALSGMLHAVPLYGEALIRRWQARLADYPDGLARAMVEKHLSFFPIWYVEERFVVRDATLWLYQTLVDASHNILGILAGINRLYYSTFQFKRMRQFVAEMRIAPERLAERLDELFQGDPRTAIDQIEALVGETVALVETHMPAVETAHVRRRLGQRAVPWRPVAHEQG